MTTVPQFYNPVQDDFLNIFDDIDLYDVDPYDNSDGRLDEILFLVWLWRNCANFAHEASDAIYCEPGYQVPVMA